MFEALRPGWQINPRSIPDRDCEEYVTETGEHIATLEWFDERGPFYPHAHDLKDGRWKRGGPFIEQAAAKLWAERIAGVSPRKPGEYEGSPSHPIAGRAP